MMRILSALLILIAHCAPIRAEPFYQDKTLRLIVTAGVGSGFDIEGRFLARMLQKHLPDHPEMVVENKPGAGGIVGINYMGTAKPDGLTMAYVSGYFDDLLLPQQGRMVGDTDLVLLANAGSVTICYARSTLLKDASGLADIAGLKVGGMNPRASTDARQRLAVHNLGLRDVMFVDGYRSMAAARLAVMSGEIDFTCESEGAYHSAVQPQGQTIALFKIVPRTSAEAGPPELPRVQEYIERRRGAMHGPLWNALNDMTLLNGVNRSFFFPAGTPQAAVMTMKRAFEDLQRDPEFARLSQTHLGYVMRFQTEAETAAILEQLRQAEGTRSFLKSYVAGP